MNTENCKVFIVDDDESVRRSLSLLLQSAGYKTEFFSNSTDFLAQTPCLGTGCVLLDVFLDNVSALDIQSKINSRFYHIPIIFITGQGNVPLSVRALKQGAINFLQKPLDEDELFKAIEEAIAKSRVLHSIKSEKDCLSLKMDLLTPREYEIFQLIITGMLNKQIAAELSITEHTVKLHRGKITEKLGVKSAAEMVYIAEKLNIAPPMVQL